MKGPAAIGQRNDESPAHPVRAVEVDVGTFAAREGRLAEGRENDLSSSMRVESWAR
ncbi:hypothetical protein [Mycetocola sp. 2940]|uniref:hypothetical protein n=1 Tax=Mycetocola sp. 2940 TaxID=3156452 RepID=UPI00339A82C6